MRLNKSIEEYPYLRDQYIEMALLEYKQNHLDKVQYYRNEALKIKINNKSYINEVFSFDHTIYDLLSICFFIKMILKSLLYINKALEISPSNERLINNK